MEKTKRMLIIPGAVVLVALAVLLYLWYRARRDAQTIHVSGNIEVISTEVSFKLPGRVMERLVDEGEFVKAGQVVARLDSRELEKEVGLRRAEVQAMQATLLELERGSRPEEIAQAEAAEQQTRARLDELVHGARPEELAAAEAVVARAQAEAERARLDDERYEGLYKKQIVSAQQRDLVRTTFVTAQARLREAEEQLKLVREGPRREQIEQARAAWLQAKERLALVREGPRQETIWQARARLRQAQEALALAETRLSYATLTSPLSGVVLSKNIEPGEFVAAGTPIVTVGDLENVWVRAFIIETDLGRVKVGQVVRVKTDTYPGRTYEGRVSFIASQAEFTPKNVQTQKERVKLVYRIKVDLKNPNMELKPGMPADAYILLDSGSEGR